MDLFSPATTKHAPKPSGPLADRMRPCTLDEFVGQEHLLGEDKILRQLLFARTIPSMILWGPPGTGKTTLAHLIAETAGKHFVSFSAVTSGVQNIKEVIKEARHQWTYNTKETILFVDEIHRFNKAQQDAFLPHIEGGTIVLIGATTENPSFEVIAPLLSRSRVFTLNPLSEQELIIILERALKDKIKGLGEYSVQLSEEAIEYITQFSDGDARAALNTLELAVLSTQPNKDNVRNVSAAHVQEAMQKKALLYDKAGEEHYNLISALHKSLRDSDADGALYWLIRMLEAGEDPLYIARRMVRFASEDIGNADPQALQLAVAGYESYRFLGSPEGELSLVQVAVYLACAPKSNAIYSAYREALQDVRTKGSLPVPLHLRNAPTTLMRNLGYGKGYQYAHNFPEALVNQEHLPEPLKGRGYYKPTNRGKEAEIRKRLEIQRKMKLKDPKDEIR
ncbi:MAG: replication-associated recombination protein A [Deltaproteobacteria bacterium]|nr:replication-associated recombination protein A [Deltaproteobacteria bacterium]